VRVKKLAAESGVVSYESALQELFGLSTDGPAVAVAVADLPEGQLTTK